MKINYYNVLRVYVRVLVILFAVFFAWTASAQDEPVKKNKKENRIHITADKLITDNEAMYADFIGNVKAVQGAAVITSDQLKIYYTKNSDDTKKEAHDKESIKKVVASGNVTIKMDDKIAKSKKAVYITETETLVLTGEGSKILSGNNTVSGGKITLYRSEDRMTVESGANKRVEAIVFPGGKGIN